LLPKAKGMMEDVETIEVRGRPSAFGPILQDHLKHRRGEFQTVRQHKKRLEDHLDSQWIVKSLGRQYPISSGYVETLDPPPFSPGSKWGKCEDDDW
jgi:hypothetical protein